MNKKARLLIVVEGTPLAIRVVPHNKDASKLVIKAAHPEVASMFCHLAGVKCGVTWEGRNFFMTEVDKGELVKAVGATVAALPDESSAVSQKLALTAPTKCVECGCDDGGHWNFCPNHKLLVS